MVPGAELKHLIWEAAIILRFHERYWGTDKILLS
jgi:hypothetical protein